MCTWYLPVDVEAAIVVAFDEKPQHCFAGNDPHPGCLLALLQSTASPPTITPPTTANSLTQSQESALLNLNERTRLR